MTHGAGVWSCLNGAFGSNDDEVDERGGNVLGFNEARPHDCWVMNNQPLHANGNNGDGQLGEQHRVKVDDTREGQNIELLDGRVDYAKGWKIHKTVLQRANIPVQVENACGA
jgi:hypothetical protein